jgi:hypothetical protein
MIKKVLLIIFLAAWLGGTAQAGLVTFDFNSLEAGTSAEEIGSYMTELYDSPVTVLDATTNNTAGGYLDDSMHLIDVPDSYGNHRFTISFDEVPIRGLSFDWRRQQDEIHLDVEGVTTTGKNVSLTDVFFDISPGSNGGSASGPGEWISFNNFLIDEEHSVYADVLVNKLIFHDSDKGFIEIDNLLVSPVPLPASILLGAFAVGLAGWKLRRLALT